MPRIDTSGSHYVRHLRREKPTYFWKDPAQESSGGLSAPETVHEAPSKSLKFLFGLSVEGALTNLSVFLTKAVAVPPCHQLVGHVEKDVVLFGDVSPDELDISSSRVHQNPLSLEVSLPSPGQGFPHVPHQGTPHLMLM
jgi:hypothetical protein